MTINSNKDISVIKSVEAEPASKQYLVAYVDFGAVAKPRKKEVKFSLMTADNIQFNPDKRIASLAGNVTLKKGDMTVNSDKVSIDLNKDSATFETRSRFRNKSAQMSADRSTAYFDIEMIELSGSVEVLQKNKKARSPSAVYDDKSKDISMSGGVTAVIERPGKLLKKSSSKKYTGKEAREMLSSRTNVVCNKLVIDTGDNSALASGKVDVKQKDKEAVSDKAVYSDTNGTIIMTGSVYMKKKEDWIKANTVTVYVDKDIFEASGGVETTFKVNKGSRR